MLLRPVEKEIIIWQNPICKTKKTVFYPWQLLQNLLSLALTQEDWWLRISSLGLPITYSCGTHPILWLSVLKLCTRLRQMTESPHTALCPLFYQNHSLHPDKLVKPFAFHILTPKSAQIKQPLWEKCIKHGGLWGRDYLLSFNAICSFTLALPPWAVYDLWWNLSHYVGLCGLFDLEQYGLNAGKRLKYEYR